MNVTKNNLPNSCCEPEVGGLGGSKCDIFTISLHRKGCLETFGDFIRYHTQAIEAAGLGIAFVQVNYNRNHLFIINLNICRFSLSA